MLTQTAKSLTDLYDDMVAAGTLDKDPGQRAALEALEHIRTAVAATEGRRGIFGLFRKQAVVPGLYLWGDVGRGKTMMMDMFFSHLPDKVDARRVHFHEFMLSVHDYLHEQRQGEDTGGALMNFADGLSDTTDVLCFDEFHVTDIADAMILGRLFKALFSHGVTIVLTTNWPPDRLYEGGLQRERFLPFIDLIKDNMTVVEIGDGPDHRLLTLKDTGVYFTPLNARARKKADEVFDKLTDKAEPHAEESTVKGRTLHVDRTAKGIARFTFSQLCEKPLAAQDYLRIAKTYHTVFLEGIPRLTYDRRNETKRLMTLIDTLYDNNVKLVATAAEWPERLYTGHDYDFEFQRTVSRLNEMQSEEYLEKSA